MFDPENMGIPFELRSYIAIASLEVDIHLGPFGVVVYPYFSTNVSIISLTSTYED